jgi:putative addiction module CopG family antidote
MEGPFVGSVICLFRCGVIGGVIEAFIPELSHTERTRDSAAGIPVDATIPTVTTARNVSLPEALDHFIEVSVKLGRSDNATEEMSAGLRVLQQEVTVNVEKFAWLKKAIAEGIASGDAPDGSLERIRQRIKDRAAEKAEQTKSPATVQI